MGMGIKSISSAFHLSRNTVRKYVRKYQESGLTMEQMLSMSEDKFQNLFLDSKNRSRVPSPRRTDRWTRLLQAPTSPSGRLSTTAPRMWRTRRYATGGSHGLSARKREHKSILTVSSDTTKNSVSASSVWISSHGMKTAETEEWAW